MSKLAAIKQIILEAMSDYEEHTASELRGVIEKRGIFMEEGSSAFRTAIYQMKNNGVNIESRERGVYCLVPERVVPQLKGFTVLKPINALAKRCVYVHEDGKIILNGKLNGDIKSRKIEIRIAEGGMKIALIVDGVDYHKFTKSGNTKNEQLVKMLSEKKAKFPICYDIDESSDGIVWTGCIRKSKSV